MISSKWAKSISSFLTVALIGIGFTLPSDAASYSSHNMFRSYSNSNSYLSFRTYTNTYYGYSHLNSFYIWNLNYSNPVRQTPIRQVPLQYQPAPAQQLVIQSAPAPQPAPQPVTQPTPAPQPVTQPTPAPQPVTQPTPAPQPVIQPAPAPQPAQQIPVVQAQASSEIQQVLALVNQERAKAGIAPLKLSDSLDNMAKVKAEDMRDQNYFSHTSPTYGSPFEMMTKFGIPFTSAGENIAAGQQSAADVMNSWMNSPGHRQNILNPSYTEIGIGVAKGGSYGIYWVQDFIRP